MLTLGEIAVENIHLFRTRGFLFNLHVLSEPKLLFKENIILQNNLFHYDIRLYFKLKILINTASPMLKVKNYMRVYGECV